MPRPTIFVSHASADDELARALVALLQDSVGLAPDAIRATSIEGYRLDAGASVNERLREEIRESDIVIAMLTPASLASAFVLFELGARWATGKEMLPILGAGLTASQVPAPLSSLNAFDGANQADVLQLIDQVAEGLAQPPRSAASYLPALQRFTKHAASRAPTTTSLASDQRISPAIDIAATSRKPGHAEIFILTEIGIYHARMDEDWAKQWSDWSPFDDITDGVAIAAGTHQDDELEVVIGRADGSLLHGWSDSGGSWNDFKLIPPSGDAPNSIRDVTVDASQRDLQTFALTETGRVLACKRTGRHRWQPWTKIADAPSAVAVSTALTPSLTVLGAAHEDGCIAITRLSDAAGPGSGDIAAFGNSPNSAVDLAIAASSPTRADVFVLTGTGRVLQTHSLDRGRWQRWQQLGTVPGAIAIAACSDGDDGRTYVAVITPENQTQFAWSDRNGAWRPLRSVSQ